MSGRIGATALTAMVVGVGMVLLGMEPRPVLVGIVVVTVAATTFLLVDLANLTWAVSWGGHEHVATEGLVGGRPTRPPPQQDPPTDAVEAANAGPGAGRRRPTTERDRDGARRRDR